MVARLFEKGSASNKALSVIVSFLLVFSLLSLSLAGAPEAFADEGVVQQAVEGAVSEGADALSGGGEALNATSSADQPDQSLQSSSASEASGEQAASSASAASSDAAALSAQAEPSATPAPSGSVSSSAAVAPQAKSDPALSIKLLDSSDAELPDSATVHIGDTVTVAAVASGVEDARFNYVWVRDNDWSEGSWNSTVNSGNPPTKEIEWDFTPRIPGTYELYVDLKRASGSTVLTKSITLKVVEEWNVDSLSVPSAGKTLHMGDPIQVDVKVSGADADAARFNYVWVRDNDWSKGSWDSTINATGASTAETSWTFTPSRSGSYAIYIDTIRADGTKTTSKAYGVTVREDWTFDGFDLSARTILLGEPLEVTAKASGVDADFARFNYVWNYRGDWSEWSSVELETGAPTPNDTWTFTPKRAGKYEIYVDAVRTDGSRVTKASSVTVESNWAAEGLVLTSNGEPLQGGKVALGAPLEVSFDMKEGSNLTGLTYNFVWQRGTSWASGEWDSLANQGKVDTTGSHVYHLDRTGTYWIHGDVIGTDGAKRTLSAQIQVVLPYDPTGVTLANVEGAPVADAIALGGSVVVSPVATGDLSGALFNYVWSYEGGWDDGEWDSTVNRTGSNTKDASWTFTPEKYGTYQLYVDFVAADGTKETLSTMLEVDRGWSSGKITIDKASPQLTGTTLTIEPNVSGESAQYVRYNYVWQRDGWTQWSSNLKETGTYTADTSLTFTPTHSGDYQFAIDYYDTRTGQAYTQTVSFRVNKAWDLQRLDLSYSSPLRPWSAVTFKPVITGDKSQLKYNYVWQRDGWAEWNSSLNASGGTYHPTDTGTWVIGASGWYSFYIDVVDQFGETETMQVEGIRGYSVSDAISSIERCLAGGWDSSGWKYENDLLIAGGSLCNGRHGWWCANYLWWGFRQAGFSDLWGNGSLQVDPEYVANEYQWLGRYHWGTAGVRRGDILFSYMAPWRAGQTITHAAYVVSVSGSSVTVVEGNAGWSNYRTYSLWDPIFKGYARPAY